MYEFITEWLPITKENVEFIQREALRISKENTVGIIKDNKNTALIKEIRMTDILKRKHIREVLEEKRNENMEIQNDLKEKKVIWISNLNIPKS